MTPAKPPGKAHWALGMLWGQPCHPPGVCGLAPGPSTSSICMARQAQVCFATSFEPWGSNNTWVAPYQRLPTSNCHVPHPTTNLGLLFRKVKAAQSRAR